MIRSFPRARIEGLREPGSGLWEDEVASRFARYGPNDVVEAQAGGWRDLARQTARDPMLWFLVGSSVLSALLGERAEALTLLAALVPFVSMDAWLHRRTQASTEGLASRLATSARVVREGVEVTIPSIGVVPGDLAVVEAGESFPADGILVAGEELHAEESSLTGEAWPVPKSPLARLDGQDSELRFDVVHWAFAGTRLLSGRARLRVVHTGKETLYGEIVRSAGSDSSSRRGRGSRTPLQGAIARLVSVLLAAAGLACIALAAVRLQQGHGPADALLSALTLAVAALPEEFPVVFAVFLGVGVHRLARRRALVRRAAVVESIGRVTCICSDKTGTITEGVLRVVGDEPRPGMSSERLRLIAAIASPPGGDPLNEAIVAALPAGMVVPPTVAQFPFTEGRRRETVLAREGPGVLLAAVKGAPESILPLTTLSNEEQAESIARVKALAAAGRKVIACAFLTMEESAAARGEPDRGFSLAGFLLCEDPVRASASEAVRVAHEAGIRIILVTGDHPETARAVARRIGLGNGQPEVVQGDEFEARRSLGAPGRVLTFDVLARALPAQKLQLVRALQESGEVVAVTGDGVNDVPALQVADVGIAMGERGTRSAREAAAIVLLEDDLGTITAAIAEGRQLFENLRRSFAYLLAIHIPFVVSAAVIPLLGYPLLYLPVHVVWLELVIHPTAMLVFQGIPSGERMRRPPRVGRPRFFETGGWIVVLGTGAVLALLVIGGYARSLGEGRDVEHARAMAMAVMSVASAALAAALSRLATRIAWIVTTLTLGFAAVLLQVPVLAARLHVSPLHVGDGLVALAAGTLAALPLLAWASRRR
jgi:Ca2+-transporting ATPase